MLKYEPIIWFATQRGQDFLIGNVKLLQVLSLRVWRCNLINITTAGFKSLPLIFHTHLSPVTIFINPLSFESMSCCIYIGRSIFMTIKLLTCNYVVFITGFWQFCRKSVANIRIILFLSKFWSMFFKFFIQNHMTWQKLNCLVLLNNV